MIAPPFDWIIPLAAAPFIGSFLSVLVVRLPKGEDIVSARSHCRCCNRILTPIELVPVVSWLAQNGKCRGCGAKVDTLYPIMEVAAVAVVLCALPIVGRELLWITAVLGWMLIALIAMDLREFILSDALTLPLVAIGLAVAWWLEPASVHLHVLGAALGFVLMFGANWTYNAFRGRDGLGQGDAKLMAAAGAWVGVEGVGTVLLYAAVIGLALAMAQRVAGKQIDATTPIPFGVGIASGLWLVWLGGPLFLAV